MRTGNPSPVFALVVTGIDVKIHRHSALQFVVSLDRPYPAQIDGLDHAAVDGFLVDADVPHACASAGSALLIACIDAISGAGRVLHRALAGRRFQLLQDAAATDAGRGAVRVLRERHARGPAIDLAAVERFVRAVAPSEPAGLDERIAAAVAYFADRGVAATAAGAARAAGISERRLRQLFAERVGAPPGRVALWLRLRAATEAIAAGATLVEAAHDAGFSDQSHFTNAFTAAFGVPPARLSANVRFLSAHDAPARPAASSS